MSSDLKTAALFDTNVLVYASDASSPQHVASKKLRDQVEAGAFAGFLTPQVLWEYFSVITSRRVAKPRTTREALTEIRELSKVFLVIEPSVPFQDVLRMAASIQIKGPQIYDLVIALTARNFGIPTVYTYDNSVFGRVAGIAVIEPS